MQKDRILSFEPCQKNSFLFDFCVEDLLSVIKRPRLFMKERSLNMLDTSALHYDILRITSEITHLL